jgi:cytochrome c-type biogenesis protein CcmH
VTTLFLLTGIGLTLGAVALVVVPLLKGGDGHNAPVTATVTAVLLPAFVILVYMSASNFDWDADEPVAVANNGELPEMAEAVAALEDRLAREPDDVEGWLLLGRSYLQLRRFKDAERAYRTVLELGDDNVAKLGLAETAILEDRTSLAREAGQLVEEVLAEEPDNQRALFYGGMVAGARNDMATLESRWRRLLDLSPPPQIRDFLEAQLNALGSESERQVEVEQGGGIDVQISVDDKLRPNIKPGATLFLVAREPGVPGPPIAVVRRNAGDLPMQVKISDADAMLPGRTLSGLAEVQLIARIANSGEPTAQPGDISGEVRFSRETVRSGGVSITMDTLSP